MRVRLVRPWDDLEIDFPEGQVSTRLPLSEADGLIAEWAPSPELLEFSGPKAWYTAEPHRWKLRRFDQRLRPSWRRVIAALRPDQRLHHSHPDPAFRVPHVTHRGDPEVVEGSSQRTQGIVAVVSNAGGLRVRWPAIRLRNRMVTRPEVSLFGDVNAWRHYRGPWRGRPPNYSGEIPGSWGDSEKIRLMARFHVAVCMESVCEPWYFTEKFVDAVIAGCVPIYRAHPTVCSGVLAGAAWIDPADHGFCPERTVEAALRADRGEISRINARWLRSDTVKETGERAVLRQILGILESQREKLR